MNEFVANRLATGNRLFPAKVTIDDFGVTLKIPGLFSGEEKSLGFHQISSVKVDSPMIGFSKITFNTIGWDRIVAEGFEKSDAEEIKSLVQRGIAASRGGHQVLHSSAGSIAQVAPDPAAIAAAQAASAAAEAEKARIDLERKKHEDDVALKKRQQSEAEKANRRKRASELRANGHAVQAFFVEFSTSLGAVGAGILLVGILSFMAMRSKSTAHEGAEINAKLEQIEDQVKIAIADGNRDKALALANQLVHPLHEKWEDDSKFSGWNGYPYYDEWWSQKREDYKSQIFSLPVLQANLAYNADTLGMAGSTAQLPPVTDVDTVVPSDPESPLEVTATPDGIPSATGTSKTPTPSLFRIEDPDGFANLRDAPNGMIVRKVLREERFKVLGTDGAFQRVQFSDGTEGFIHGSRVVAAE